LEVNGAARIAPPRKMILLDPDLDPHPAPKKTSAKKLSAPHPTVPEKNLRLPTARTLARFLALAQAAVRLKGEVTVQLTTDLAIRRLNRQFRGKDKATDVLSFPADGIGAEEIAGDLAISVPTALRQALEQGHSLSTEVKVLILHGLLHLAGYDHEADTGLMARRERLLRARLRLPQGLIERVETAAQPPRRGESRIAQGKRSAALGVPAQNVPAPRRAAAKSRLPQVSIPAHEKPRTSKSKVSRVPQVPRTWGPGKPRIRNPRPAPPQVAGRPRTSNSSSAPPQVDPGRGPKP